MTQFRFVLFMLWVFCFIPPTSSSFAQTVSCGDGMTDTSVGEQCDDGKQCEDGITDCTNNTAVCAGIGGGTCAPRGTDCCSTACTFKSATSSCDDGNGCTQLDLCDGRGNCRGYQPLSCSAPAVCDINTGSCVNAAAPVCGNGVVDAGEQCDDGRSGGCCSDSCTFETTGTVCDDANACTQTATCDGAGQCVGADPVSCEGAADGCSGVCNPLTGGCDSCRDINNPNGYCDLTTRECVNSNPICPEFQIDVNGVENKCTISAGVDPTTGLCLYKPKVCAALGCNLESCNPSTGACQVTANDPFACGSSGIICRNRDDDGTPCDSTACSYEHCRRNPNQPSNCDKIEVVNCAAVNPSTCQTSLGCTPGPGAAGSGCQYTSTTCAPPADPCVEELIFNGTATGCCTYRPKDCAAEFGNNPHYNYTCTVEGTVGVCHANDTTPPTITCPANVSVESGQPINLGTPTVSDLVDPNPTVSNNAPTAYPIGLTTVTWTARDASGNTASCTQTVTVTVVQYPFTGFFPPVDNPPTINTVKAGQSIPVKFSLGGNYGLGILAAGSPSSQPIACASGMPDDIEEVTTSNSGLTYDATTNQYKYVWKTQKSWAGTCRQFLLTLTDGSTHTANFQFK